jgi:hypothetical protein
LETRSCFVWQGAIVFKAGVDSSVLDCFKKSEATPPSGIHQRFLKKRKPFISTNMHDYIKFYAAPSLVLLWY